MTVRIPCLLLLLTACFLYAHSESQWATKEEEEEDELNVVSSNESFKRNPTPRTLSYRNSSDSSEESDDVSWIPDSGHNLSDSDTASLSGEENGIEPEDDVQPSPVLERPAESSAPASLLDDDRPPSSSLLSESEDRSEHRQSLLPLASSATSNVQPSSSWPALHLWSRPADDALDSPYVQGQASCSLADDGCDTFSRTVADASATEGASVGASPSAVLVPRADGLLQSTRTADSNSSPARDAAMPRATGNRTRDVRNDSDVAPTPETSPAQTSENLILVERTSDSKSSDPSGNDSAKTKHPKHAGLPDSERPYRTLPKVPATSLGAESGKDPVAGSGSDTDSFFENVSTSSGTTSSSGGRASTAQEAEYVIAISDKIITPTVEYAYYVNRTSERGESASMSRTELSVSRTSPGTVVSTDMDAASLSGAFLLPSFSETRGAPASEGVTQEGHGATPALSASSAEDVSATSVQWPPHSSATAAADGAAPSEAEGEGAVPRLSNPSCSSLPVCVGVALPGAAWPQFCAQAALFRRFLARLVSAYSRRVRAHQVVLDAPPCVQRDLVAPGRVAFAFYVVDESGEYEEVMTEFCGLILRKGAAPEFQGSVMEVRLFAQEGEGAPPQRPAHPVLPEVNSGFVAAVTVSSVAGVALCLLCVLLVVVKQRLLAAGRGGSPAARASPSDDYSLDSLSINASFRRRRGAQRRSARSYLNHAFADQEIASHPLSEKDLVDCLKDKEFLEDEFKKIPMNTAKFDEIPEGADVKNRYSNVLPKPETRVILAEPSGDPLKSYINANYVKGHDGKPLCYVACQAPLPEGGMEDFWRMVWEQQSRVIVMLTMFEENGVSRCAPYFPQSSLVTMPPFGDFQISLLKKEVYEFYTMSTFRLFDLERNLFREVTHLWYMMWPAVGVPSDPSNLVTFLLQCRPFINCNSGPTVVHCSTGTGRTGVFLALDICMREYDDSRSVDILRCVTQLRRDRGGAVQNKDQYFLIHEAMLEYASRIANQSQRPSIRSNS